MKYNAGELILKEFICISCPVGCMLSVEQTKSEIKVSGNKCNKGKLYAVNEVTAPKRAISTTVKLIGGSKCVLPVKTNGAVAKELIFDIIRLCNSVEVNAPVKAGDIIIENALNTGINIVSITNQN